MIKHTLDSVLIFISCDKNQWVKRILLFSFEYEIWLLFMTTWYFKNRCLECGCSLIWLFTNADTPTYSLGPQFLSQIDGVGSTAIDCWGACWFAFILKHTNFQGPASKKNSPHLKTCNHPPSFSSLMVRCIYEDWRSMEGMIFKFKLEKASFEKIVQ